jgi:hypothetical protein
MLWVVNAATEVTAVLFAIIASASFELSELSKEIS